MSNIDDLVGKGKQFLEENKEQIDEVLHGEQAESFSDSVLDAGAEFVKKLAPDQYDAKVDEMRDQIDKSIGTE